MGYELGDNNKKISQNKRKNKIKKIQDTFNRTLLFPHTYTRENFLRFIEEMFKYRPKYLRSYPDPLYFLCQMAQKENSSLPKLKRRYHW